MQATYLNPVYTHTFPDPFVFKFRGEYWAYATGAWPDGRWFGVLRSRDLALWEELGGVMEPLPGDWPCLWAPEVSYHNGVFYLYYSCGDETSMELRVATARHPAGPFVDSGKRLSGEPFAIDAHVFVDEDGARHLFYATDYLEHSHVGTGTARMRLADPLTPVGASTPVTRPRYNWQVFDPQRAAKGGVRWHTIEGSFVLKHKGRYYQMFSGGNWQNPSYGVSYAISERIDTPEEWTQVADGERVTPILRTVPGLVIGPGHNSAVRGPNNQELFCVYHRWAEDLSGRPMAIDRLDWAGERMFLIGPTTTPQPVYPPTVADFFDQEWTDGLGPGWICSGSWSCADGEAVQHGTQAALARCTTAAPQFVAEVSLRAIGQEPRTENRRTQSATHPDKPQLSASGAVDPATSRGIAEGLYGVAVGDRARFMLDPARRRALGQLRRGAEWDNTELPLPPDFVPAAYHLLRIELNAGRLTMQLDEAAARWELQLEPGKPLALGFCTEGAGAAFAGFALTEGWCDLFFPDDGAPAAWGWHGDAGWRVAAGALLSPPEGGTLLKGPLPAAFELCVNARLADPAAHYGFYLAARPDARGPLVIVEHTSTGWSVAVRSEAEETRFPLPAGFDPARFQQLRAVVAGGTIHLSWEGIELGLAAAPAGASHVGLYATGAAAFDLVRVTDLPPLG
jgi:GH43 family beta-xylosidase